LSKEAVPTKAGELLYGYAKRMLALRAETETAMAEFRGKIRGRLVIGGSTIPGTYLIPQLISDFKKKYPDVIVSLTIGDSENIIEGILSGNLELGVVGAKAENKKILQKKLIEDEMCLIIPANHHWAVEKSVSFANKDHHIEDLNVVAELGSTQAICQGIKTGAGVSILSTLAVSEDLQTQKLIALEVDGLNLKRNFYLTWHRYRSPSPLSEAFLDFLEQKLK
jgi:DNA-binding transcriptional LysR family regulator